MVHVKSIILQKVRNIPRTEIPLDDNERKHLILTGPNGSGKTTVIRELESYFDGLASNDPFSITSYYKNLFKDSKESRYEDLFTASKGQSYKNTIARFEKKLIEKSAAVVSLTGNDDFYPLWLRGEFIICTFGAHREPRFQEPGGPKKIEQPKSVKEWIGNYFVQLLVNLRSRRSFANDEGDIETVDKIQKWFDNFNEALATLLEHRDFELKFDPVNFNYTIKEKDKEAYHFSELSDGYSALLLIVAELMLRMSIDEPLDSYNKQGIVLIDEVENHLHVSLQKKVMPFLTKFFPKVQFIVTTHSPFVLSSIKDSVIFDLEKRRRFTDFSEYSYSSIIEDYYDEGLYSDYIVDAVGKIEELLKKDVLSEEEVAKIKKLYDYVMNIPETRVTSPELRVKLKDLIIKNRSKLHGVL